METEITEESIREFASGGGMPPEEVEAFLNSRCFDLTLRIDAEVALELIESGLINQKCLVVGCDPGADGTLELRLWMPAHHQELVVETIRKTYEAKDLPRPIEFFDFANMDQATIGRNYVKAMLLAMAEAGSAEA